MSAEERHMRIRPRTNNRQSISSPPREYQTQFCSDGVAGLRGRLIL